MRLAIVPVLAAACGSAPTQPDAFVSGGAVQMNDVSILYPMGGTPSQYLAASDSGARGALLPEALYVAVGPISGTGNPTPGGGIAEYGDLRVVALRVDPCFATLAPDPHGAGCTNQLRLIFQEVKDGSAFDSAVHVFYQLSRDDLVTLVHELGGLRAAGSSGERLGALAPHPILVEQGLDGPMAAGVRALVLRYAGAQNLTRVAKLSAVGPGTVWDFTAFDVSDATAPTIEPFVIPTVGGVPDQTFQVMSFPAALSGRFQPATTSADDLVPLADHATAIGLTAEARQAAFDGLARIDNPAHDSPNTIDCASCHLATPVARLAAQPVFGLVEADDAFAFAADGTWVLPSELVATFDATGPFQVHAFSYVGTSPAIDQRTVNETAAIVAYLNEDAP